MPFTAQRPAPVPRLTDEARRYLTHQVEFPGDSAELWTWTETGPAPRIVSKSEAESYLGLKFARQALDLDPKDQPAQVVLVALALQNAIRVGPDAFPAQDPTGAYPQALAAGPAVLSQVLRLALREGLHDLAAAAVMTLGHVADRDAMVVDAPAHPLVEALAAPDRRVRFAAAQALVELDPLQPFAGSDRVVPVLGQFLAAGDEHPEAVVIDGDVARGNAVAGVLQALGYDTSTAASGPQGFRRAARSAAVELVFVMPRVLEGPWLGRDLLANLRADAATAGIPIFLYGPLKLEDQTAEMRRTLPRVAFVPTPADPDALKPVLERELARMGVRPFSPAERQRDAAQAAALLATISARAGSPFRAGIAALEPELAAALRRPPLAAAVSATLADVPRQDAQRGLADLVLDPSRPAAQRIRSAADLARSIQRFGPLVAADQERSLADELDAATDPALKAALAEVVGALRPKPDTVGPRLRAAIAPAAVLASPVKP